MNGNENKVEMLEAAAAKVSAKVSAGTLSMTTSRPSKVQELLKLSDSLRNWHRAGLRAPAIAKALADEGYSASAVTVRRALNIAIKTKKSRNTGPAKSGATPLQIIPQARNNAAAETVKPIPDAVGAKLTNDQIADMLKDN